MSNSNTDLLKRLLHLLPIQVVKDKYKMKGNAVDIINTVVGNIGAPALKKFVFENMAYTRQNVHIYSLGSFPPKSKLLNGFPLTIEIDQSNTSAHIFFCLPVVTFSVYLNNPVVVDDLKFYQPLIVKIEGKTMTITHTKLEADIKHHFHPNRDAKKNSESNSEEATRTEILDHIELITSIVPSDINKGVKHLWEKDELDCHKISYLNAHSTDSAVMNGALTFKQKYPKEYKELIKKPINSAIWKYLKNDDYLCQIFTADLSKGTISITRFPNTSDQVSNVISKILAHN
jgi:hypothetical protein